MHTVMAIQKSEDRKHKTVLEQIGMVMVCLYLVNTFGLKCVCPEHSVCQDVHMPGGITSGQLGNDHNMILSSL